MDSEYTVYDTIPAHTVEEGDNIMFSISDNSGAQEIMTVSSKVDEGDCVLLTGFSHVDGDNVHHRIVPADREVHLWTL